MSTFTLNPANFLNDAQLTMANVIANQCHWLKVNPDDNVIEIYLDHHALSMYRVCPARFNEEMVHGYKQKGIGPAGSGAWSLEFGILFHDVMEYFYTNFRRSDFSVAQALEFAESRWVAGNFEEWKESKGYKNVNGLIGFKWLVNFYFTRFASENERLRIIGTELYFGKGKEVPLQLEPTFWAPFRLYYAGKMDLICDDGEYLSPMDHKTSADFRGKNPNDGYLLQDGMTGYVYSFRELVKKFDLEQGSRKLNSILMNYIQVKMATTLLQQFSRIRMYKSDYQLEQFRLRQISTARDILNMLFGNFVGLEPYYNTAACTNYWHRDCSFKSAHQQPARDSQLVIINTDFARKPIWDPENRDTKGIIIQGE
jgi:hypothetical protein